MTPLLRVDHLVSAGPKAVPRYPFVVALSIDCESGFSRADGSTVWSDVQPRALQGFTHGIDAMLELAAGTDERFTFLLSTQCFVAADERRTRVHALLERLLADGHELGLHLHPRTDELLHASLGRRLPHASAHFYDTAEQEQMLAASRGLLRAELGSSVEESVRTFRWGNWALSSDSVLALERTGFTLDSSALPGLSGHRADDRRFDWSRLRARTPFRMSRADCQDATTQDSRVLELPVPTFSYLRRGIADIAWGPLLKSVLTHYHRHADRSHAPFVFVVATHSCEMVHEDGSPTARVEVLRDFLAFARGLEDTRIEPLGRAAARVDFPIGCRPPA